MSIRRVAWWACLTLAVLLLAMAWWMSRAGYDDLKDYVDPSAPDGNVESFDRAFHDRMTANMGRVAWLFGALVVLLFATRGWFFRVSAQNTVKSSTWRADVQRALRALRKRTSTDHRRFVLLLLVMGAGLRIGQLAQAITYDEAFTYTNYVTQPFHFIASNYTYPNNHILHTLLAKVSTGIFGTHLWALRLPALLAGILVMPLFYVFVRAMFNRYIAVIALAFVAASGGLIEYSALARGYSITWLFMIMSMLAGRHFAKKNDLSSAVLVAVFNALAMWAVTTAIYAALMVYIWLVFYLIVSYDTTLRKRLLKLLASFTVFLGLTALLYTPVIVVHDLDQLLHHPVMGENTWESFTKRHQDKALELWAYLTDTAATWVSILGFIGLFYAAYVSVKFRIMILALVLGAVPLVVVQHLIGPPKIWLYILFPLHLGSAIALFYFFKMIQATLWSSLTKRVRTAVASLVVLIGLGYTGFMGIQDRVLRQGDSKRAVELLDGIIKPGDRVLSMSPWEAAFEFHLMEKGLSRDLVHKGPAPGGRTYALVSRYSEQTLGAVLQGYDRPIGDTVRFVKMQDWRLLELWAERQAISAVPNK